MRVTDQLDGLKKLFAAYTERKEQQQTLDYDDLLLFWHHLMTEPSCGDMVRQKFDCVLVDEYQDTNTLQAEIVKGLCPEGKGLTVVGDDAQSVYSFRAATVRNILDFPTQFPRTTVLPLEQNYRRSQPILDATNRVIALASEGHRKMLWSSRADPSRPYVPRTAPGAKVRRCLHASTRPRTDRTDGDAVRVAFTVPERHDAGPTLLDSGLRRRSTLGRGLPHPQHHPLRQGLGMGIGLCPPRGRWQHPVRFGHRIGRRN